MFLYVVLPHENYTKSYQNVSSSVYFSFHVFLFFSIFSCSFLFFVSHEKIATYVDSYLLEIAKIEPILVTVNYLSVPKVFVQCINSIKSHFLLLEFILTYYLFLTIKKSVLQMFLTNGVVLYIIATSSELVLHFNAVDLR